MGARAYLRLARVQTMGVTATVPLYGYLAASLASGRDVNAALVAVPTVPLLVVAGAGAHLFGFVHNEIADRAADAKAAYLRPKPLPSGDVSLPLAWTAAAAGLVLGLAAALFLGSPEDESVLAFSAGAAVLAGLYNVKGKEIVGGDAILAGSIALFVMAGGAAAAGFAGALAPATLGVAALASLILFFNNAFEGGFKDHATDREAGKRTLVLALRARGEKYDSPDGLVYFAHIPFHAAMLAAALFLIFGPLAAEESQWNYGRMLVAFGLAVALTRYYGRGIAVPERRRMLTYFAAHEMAAVVLLLMTFLPYLAWGGFAALLLLPVGVFLGANRGLYGTLAAPDV